MYTLPAATLTALLTCSLAAWLSPPAALPTPLLLIGLLASLAIARRSPPSAAALATCLLSTWLLAPLAPSTRCALPLTSPSQAELRLTITSLATFSPHGLSLSASPHDAPDLTLTLFIPSHHWPHSHPPLPGDSLTAFGSLSPLPPPLLPHHEAPHELRRQLHIVGSLSLQDPPEDLCPPSHPSPLLSLRRALATRHYTLVHAVRSLPITPDLAALTLAMTLAQRSLLSDDARRPLTRSGLAHLLAISGLHISALTLLLLATLSAALRTSAPQLVARHGQLRLCAPPTALATLLYTASVGAPLSAVRASIMACAILFALCSHRRPAPLHALCAAILLILILHPQAPLQPGFWLSSSATAAILLAIPLIRSSQSNPHSPTWRDHAASLTLTSTAAWLGTTPVLLATHGSIPLVGLLLNPIAVPLTSTLIFPALAAATLLSTSSPILSSSLIKLAHLPLDALTHLAQLSLNLPLSTLTPGVPPWPLIALCASSSLLILTRKTFLYVIYSFLLFILSLLLIVLINKTPSDQLRVTFIPVGQGDATLIQTPTGEAILIDAGGSFIGRDPGEHMVVPTLRRLGISRLDAVILTHADLDHMGGLFAVAHHLPISSFIYPAHDPSKTLKRLTALMRLGGASLDPMQPGTTRALTPTVTLLAPPGHNGNDSSLVASLRYAGHHLLLAGDLERRGEAWLAKQRLGRATLLKMPHHGSNTSSSPALLNAYQPTVAVASCGLHNRFNHPHPHVLKRYRDSGALILRTDLHGLLRVELTPNAPLRVRSQRPAGPYLLDLPQNSRHLWKTCYTPRPAEAPSPH